VNLVIKHSLDRILGALLLIMFAPLLCGIVIAVILESGRPAFFIQTRVGRNGQLFPMLKFRTMIEDAIHQGLGATVATDDVRITRIGSFLRIWSLDELPQLINILKGEMSFVGPRPTLEYQVANYTPLQRRRLEMKPGVTGWAQVNGRNSLTWPQRIELDIWYVDHHSLALDFQILFRTIGVWVRREGLYGTDGVNDDFIKKPHP
jgi:lipopolysaccharide/colanic/teichoic acid biosynthesis glycosyltransferase